MKFTPLLCASTVCAALFFPPADAQTATVTLRSAPSCSRASPGLTYPVSRTVDQKDTYHGTVVPDPYRWLEDANSADTRSWVEAQNKVTHAWLDQIPRRAAIRNRLTQLWNFERYNTPFREGGRTFYTRNDGLQNQAVLYTVKSLDETPRVLLDPNTLSKDGTVALAGMAVSPDGKLLAYGTAVSGSDWNEWRVRNIETGQDLPDLIQWVKFSSAAWTRDGKGFFYSRYPEPQANTKLADVNRFQKLYYHAVGTPQSADVLVLERPDQKDWGFGGTVSEDGRYLIIEVWKGSAGKNGLMYKDLHHPETGVLVLSDSFDASYKFIGNQGPVFLLRSNKDAPLGRVIALDTRKPRDANLHEVVPASTETLVSAHMLNQQLVLNYLADAKSAVRVTDLQGKPLHELQLPGIGSVSGFTGKPGDTETFYSFSSFTQPSTVYRYDLQNRKASVFRQPKVDFDPAAYETRQAFVTSKDGTRVPMFIVAKKGLRLDGSNPTYLYGYGGFNVSLTPSFSVANLAWMEMGGVYVLANLRGGGEYGKAWHEAGTKLKKQNVFDDFIAAGEYLVAQKITSPARLAIGGGSNGGTLVGAVMIQRPDLFGAALPAVGVMDMLRYEKFTIGWAWASDYGSTANADEFAALYRYSPLHTLRPGTCYPATLITTADHDDRVVPAHSFKFAAAAQAAHTGSTPMLIRIETKAGHGAGKPIAKVIEEVTDRWGFLSKVLNMP